jgi:hypothetical protein
MLKYHPEKAKASSVTIVDQSRNGTFVRFSHFYSHVLTISIRSEDTEFQQTIPMFSSRATTSLLGRQ